MENKVRRSPGWTMNLDHTSLTIGKTIGDGALHQCLGDLISMAFLLPHQFHAAILSAAHLAGVVGHRLCRTESPGLQAAGLDPGGQQIGLYRIGALQGKFLVVIGTSR